MRCGNTRNCLIGEAYKQILVLVT
uniref:Uncharacterized protein n=1 Tax=Anguilla anguilla TaxID=7936 RepID=A0A0E9TBM8_ANGAN